jgi:hypothetical protein
MLQVYHHLHLLHLLLPQQLLPHVGHVLLGMHIGMIYVGRNQQVEIDANVLK